MDVYCTFIWILSKKWVVAAVNCALAALSDILRSSIFKICIRIKVSKSEKVYFTSLNNVSAQFKLVQHNFYKIFFIIDIVEFEINLNFIH